jgi:hypothetical protein
MPATIERETNNLHLLQISGTLERSEFGVVQDALAKDIDAGGKPRILAILENFTGWERPAAWGNPEFLYWHSPEIAKIAIVGELRWEKEALAFAGAGLRTAPVKFFPVGEIQKARAWLGE